MMQETRDDVWCFLLARRAVARACLHLGITSVSQEVLDTLAEIVIAYLERFSRTLAASVEASRRSAGNVLDVIATVPIATTPAVQRVHQTSTAGSSSSSSSHLLSHTGGGGETANATGAASFLSDQMQDTTWKGLAAFMFGANWEQQPLESYEEAGMVNGDTAAAGGGGGGTSSNSTGHSGGVGGSGGKVGPSPSMMLEEEEGGSGGVSAAGNRTHHMMDAESNRGWCAPYPDELPPFPTLAKKRRRPNYFFETTFAVAAENDDAKSRHYDDDHDDDDGDIPDRAFVQEWGRSSLLSVDADNPDAIDSSTGLPAVGAKRRREGNTEADEPGGGGAPPSKRVRISEAVSRNAADDMDVDGMIAPPASATSAVSTMDDLFLPRFLPPFPPQRDASRTVVEAASTTSAAGVATAADGSSKEIIEDAGSLVVRSSLVALHRQQQQQESYWGSGWENHAQPIPLAVPWGRPTTDGGGSSGASGAAATGGSNSNAAATTSTAAAAAAAQIVPLGRASGSRVSRILEGSMDGP